MMKKIMIRFRRLVLPGMVACMLAGCADTVVEKTWTAPAVGSLHFTKIFVLGLTKDDTDRRLAEIAIRNEITRVDTVTSFSVLPNVADTASKAKVLQAIKASQADGLFVMRLLYRDTDISTGGLAALPMEYETFTGYYGTYYDVAAYYAVDRRQINVDSIFGIETNIYDARNLKLVWSGQTRSTKSMVESHDIGALITDVAKTIKAKLKSQDLIP
jgi:hypothetical protein